MSNKRLDAIMNLEQLLRLEHAVWYSSGPPEPRTSAVIRKCLKVVFLSQKLCLEYGETNERLFWDVVAVARKNGTLNIGPHTLRQCFRVHSPERSRQQAAELRQKACELWQDFFAVSLLSV